MQYSMRVLNQKKKKGARWERMTKNGRFYFLVVLWKVFFSSFWHWLRSDLRRRYGTEVDGGQLLAVVVAAAASAHTPFPNNGQFRWIVNHFEYKLFLCIFRSSTSTYRFELTIILGCKLSAPHFQNHKTPPSRAPFKRAGPHGICGLWAVEVVFGAMLLLLHLRVLLSSSTFRAYFRAQVLNFTAIKKTFYCFSFKKKCERN